MICGGIDAGSRALKIVLIDSDSLEIVASGVLDQGIEQDRLARRLLDELLADCNLSRDEVGPIVATGYGRGAVTAAETTITEITCHAVGVRHLEPAAKTIIDIGGEDSKLVCLDGSGKVRDFSMNDRCAAGTGRFFEVVAKRLEVGLADLGDMAARSNAPAAISSMCVVFAETEIIGLLASGASPDDIVAGVQNSIASRLVAMAGKNVEPPVIFTGGVAMIPGMADSLAQSLGTEVKVSADPQMTGALGAAVLAAGRLQEV